MSLLVPKICAKLNHPQTYTLETQKGQVGLGRSPGLRFPSNPGYQHTGGLISERTQNVSLAEDQTQFLEWVYSKIPI